MRDVRLKLPVIAMDGSVLYDTRKNSYIKIASIKNEISESIMNRILDSGLCWYANVIIDDVLIIYYSETDDEINRKLVNDLKISPLRNYVKRPLPKDENVVYFMLLDKSERIGLFYKKLLEEGFSSDLRIVTYSSEDFPGYSYIKIYDKDANKENMLKELKSMYSTDKSITFGTIEGQYDVLIRKDDANEVVRRIRKFYEPLLVRKQ